MEKVLITGGTGTFGRWCIEHMVKNFKLTIFSRDEMKQWELEKELEEKGRKIRCVLGDVKDYESVVGALRGQDVVIHAGALKIIDSCESNPLEAVKTNALGSANIKTASIERKLKRAILISTDKAVNPIGAYGMSKAIAEKIFVGEEECSKTKTIAIRFGNLVGSRGSVVPIFKKRIGENLPLEITHKEMTRFVTTLEVGKKSLDYAMEKSENREILVPKVPALRVLDLARVMAGDNYPMIYTKIRAGEKLNEELLSGDEYRRAKEDKNFYHVLPWKMEKRSKNDYRDFTSKTVRVLNKIEIADMLTREGLI